MKFEANRKIYKLGRTLGFSLSFIIMSYIWFFLLKITGKLPLSWSVFNVMGIVMLIVISGFALRKYLND